MRKTTLFFLLLLVSSTASAASSRQRIVGRTSAPQATLSGHVRDLATNGVVFSVEVEGPRLFARTDGEGNFTLRLPVGQPVILTFRRSGYETLTQTVTIAGDERREFRLTSLPTARITTTNGTSYTVDADTVEFGWAIPFSGYRRDRSARMCRPGGGEFTLDRAEIDRVEGPAVTVTDAACCTKTALTGAVFELATGERITAYFMESCDSAIMEVIARDHVTYGLVFVPLRDLREVVMP